MVVWPLKSRLFEGQCNCLRSLAPITKFGIITKSTISYLNLWCSSHNPEQPWNPERGYVGEGYDMAEGDQSKGTVRRRSLSQNATFHMPREFSYPNICNTRHPSLCCSPSPGKLQCSQVRWDRPLLTENNMCHCSLISQNIKSSPSTKATNTFQVQPKILFIDLQLWTVGAVNTNWSIVTLFPEAIHHLVLRFRSNNVRMPAYVFFVWLGFNTGCILWRSCLYVLPMLSVFTSI